MLARWCRELTGSVSVQAYKGKGNPRDEALATLKREWALVKKERDFLKEAAVFFAKGTK